MNRQNEKGAVLLTTLLVMSIMATVAVNIMDDVRFALKRTANIDSYAQADWYLIGAQNYAQSYLEDLLQKTEASALNAGLQQADPVILPIDGGTITLTVRDGSQCLSLGGLTENSGRKLFRQLLETVGWDSLSAANFTSVAADWVDEDNQSLPGGAEDYVYLGQTPAYRTPNTAFASVGELRALSTMTEEKFAALRPFVCARESELTEINIDSLSLERAPILAAVLGGIDQMAKAQQLIAQRPPQGYQNLERLSASPALSERSLSSEDSRRLIFAPAHLWIEASVNYRQVTRHAVMEFDVSNGQLTPIFKRLGTDERRPIMLETKS